MKGLVALLIVATIAVVGVVAHMQYRISELEEQLVQHEAAPAVLSDETEIVVPNWRFGLMDWEDNSGYSDEPEYTTMTLGKLREQISENHLDVLRWLNGIEPTPILRARKERVKEAEESVPSGDLLSESPEAVLVVPHVK